MNVIAPKTSLFIKYQPVQIYCIRNVKEAIGKWLRFYYCLIQHQFTCTECSNFSSRGRRYLPFKSCCTFNHCKLIIHTRGRFYCCAIQTSFIQIRYPNIRSRGRRDGAIDYNSFTGNTCLDFSLRVYHLLIQPVATSVFGEEARNFNVQILITPLEWYFGLWGRRSEE